MMNMARMCRWNQMCDAMTGQYVTDVYSGIDHATTEESLVVKK